MPIQSRRDALRILAASATGAALFTRGAFADVLRTAHDIRRLSPAARTLATLTPHQNATVIALAEIIIPETDTPGATATRVNEFIDLILTDWFEPDETRRFLDGLADLDRRARAAGSADFVSSSATAQADVVTRLDAELTNLLEADRPTTRPGDHFFFQMKRLTLTGYYTSEIGMLQERQWQVMPGAYRACEPLENLRRG